MGRTRVRWTLAVGVLTFLGAINLMAGSALAQQLCTRDLDCTISGGRCRRPVAEVNFGICSSAACNSNADCNTAFVCHQGVCTKKCDSNQGCSGTLVCRQVPEFTTHGVCMPPPRTPSTGSPGQPVPNGPGDRCGGFDPHTPKGEDNQPHGPCPLGTFCNSHGYCESYAQ